MAVSINGAVIPVVESMRDLGVLVTKDLSLSTHINDVVSRAHKRAGAILRTFVSRVTRRSLLMRAFITYVIRQTYG